MAGRRPLRVLVFATSALDRRALVAELPNTPGLELVAVCASLSATRDKLLRDQVDSVALEVSSLDDLALRELEAASLGRGVHLVPFTSGARPEETLQRVVAALLHPQTRPSLPREGRSAKPLRRLEVVAIGSSTGGPDALGDLIPRLPGDFEPTVLIAQHMPATFTGILARRLQQRSRLRIHEAVDGEPLHPGCVLIAPGDHHLEVDQDGVTARLHQGPPENSCRPSVDVLFRSVARVFGDRSIGVILTGMGRDGLEGARLMRRAGAEVIVQDEASSVVWGMPGLVAREGLASETGKLAEIAEWLVQRARGHASGLVPQDASELGRNT